MSASRTEKPASTWQVSDIADLEGSEEGLYREYKKPSEFVREGHFSWDVFTTEVAETVSAFLNSDGGVLLIGVQCDPDPRDKKIETLKPLETWSGDQTFAHFDVFPKVSQVRDRIYSNILPKPFGIEVVALKIPVSKPAKATGDVFVVTVLPSNQGAHQSAKTKLYYRRTGDGDVPMLDYEIRDVNSRRTGPLLHLSCMVVRKGCQPTEDDWKTSRVQADPINLHGGGSVVQLTVVFSISNQGRGTANIARLDIGIPKPWNIKSLSSGSAASWSESSQLRYSTGDNVTLGWMPDEATTVLPGARSRRLCEQEVSWYLAIPEHPIWPMVGRDVIGEVFLETPYTQALGAQYSFVWIPWRALAEGMPEIRGGVKLECMAGEFRVVNRELDDTGWCGSGEDVKKFEDLKQTFQIT